MFQVAKPKQFFVVLQTTCFLADIIIASFKYFMFPAFLNVQVAQFWKELFCCKDIFFIHLLI